MAFMQPEMTRKGAWYACECSKCGVTLHTHEWVNEDHNERRDAMQAGTLACDECGGKADPATFYKHRDAYAARMSAPGYLDCTDWDYGTNKRNLARDVRAWFKGA